MFEAGIDTPLTPATDKSRLNNQPEVRGLVADGVTPLLIQLDAAEAPTVDTHYTLTPVVSGGDVTGGITARLRVLTNGSWTAPGGSGSAEVQWPAGAAQAFVYVQAINAEDLTVTSPTNEVTVKLNITDEGGNNAGTRSFKLRKPPIALVHGYNTGGAWDAAFKKKLLTDGDKDPFIKQIVYGGATGAPDQPNTTALDATTKPFAALAPMLSMALKDQIETPLSTDWAFTRYDVIGHSQGGVLARMLCSAQLNGAAPPFRNLDNSYRGRFRRVVTIGSPHNGSRLVRYMEDLVNQPGIFSVVPDSLAKGTLLGFLSPLSGTLQHKFDPWGDEIAEINNPSGRWVPDSIAKFLVMGTTINGGLPPGQGLLSQSPVPAYYTIGLSVPGVGSAVLPDGSDGVVDLASELYGSGTGNSYQLSGVNCAHAEAPIFAQETNDTASYAVAQVASAALNGPGLDFGSFTVSGTLDPAIKTSIDLAAAANILVGTVIQKVLFPSPAAQPDSEGQPAVPPPASTAYSLTLTPPAAQPLQGTVHWFAEVCGPNGVTQTGLTVTPNPSDSTQVTVTVDAGVVGQVVLYANYPTTGGVTAFASPIVVADIQPASATIQSIAIEPGTASVPSGGVLDLQVWATYSNGTKLQVFEGDNAVTYTSLTPSSASVTSSGVVTIDPMVASGTATIQATYQALSATTIIQITAGLPPVITGLPSVTLPAGVPYQYQVTASNSPTNFGAIGLPPGLVIHPVTGIVSGTPTTPGSYAASISAGNSAGISATQSMQFTVLSNVATLSNLTISSGLLDPAFDRNTADYEVHVPIETATVTITPTTTDANATVKVNNLPVVSGAPSTPLALQVGMNVISIVVTAQDGVASRSYSVIVAKGQHVATLSNLTISSGILVPAFAANTADYEVHVPIETAAITITPTTTDANATVKVNDVPVVSGAASAPLTLEPGMNAIGIVVTAQDGVTTWSYSVMVAKAQADYFTELFTSSSPNDTHNQSWLFTPNNSASHYSVQRTSSVTSFPAAPAGGTVVAQGDDTYSEVILAGGATVSLYGVNYSGFYVGSNGYITFELGDSAATASLSAHFNLPRISALFTDLNPYSAGKCSWLQLSDRVAVTWEDVPEYGTANSNSFQVEMFFDGRIRITCLGVDATGGLIGLSQGLGVPPDFFPSNFDAYSSSSVTPTIQTWRQSYFGTTANTGDAADSYDYDKDGLSNLIEWACNLNPTTASTLPITTDATDAFIEFTYTRSIAALNAGAVFSVEWSDTLPGPNPWSTVGVTQTILSANATEQQVKATIPVGDGSKRFVHLKVVAPP